MLIQKEFLSISEMAEVAGVAVHTLRYWESEFKPFCAPYRTKGRQRRYTDEQVKRILEIKRLLKVEKYSIAGAKQVLRQRQDQDKNGSAQIADKGNGNGKGNGKSKALAETRTEASPEGFAAFAEMAS